MVENSETCLACGEPTHCRSLCRKHYQQFRRSAYFERRGSLVGACHCGKPEQAKGLCWQHYQQQRRAAMPKVPPCTDGAKHFWLITGRCKICGATR